MRIESKNVRFPGGAGTELAGTLSWPAETPVKAWGLFAHCFTCHRNYKGVYNVTKALNRTGYGILRFDFTGLGESKGSFADTNFSTNLADFTAAAAWMESEGKSPALLLGHSLGGAAAIYAARRIQSVRAVVTIGSSSTPRLLERLFVNQREAMASRPEEAFQVVVSGREMPFKYQFVTDLAAYDMAPVLADLGVPYLVLHSPADQTTPFAEAEKNFAAAAQPKSFVALGNADHLLSDREDAERTGGLIAAWADFYLRPNL